THWDALTKWTPEFFRERYGETELEIDDWRYKMSDFIEQVVHSELHHPAPYLRNYLIEKHFPELMVDILPLPQCTRPNWFDSRLFPSKESCTFIELYIGGHRARFSPPPFDVLHTPAL